MIPHMLWANDFSYIQNLASSKLTWPVCFSIVMIFSQVDTFPRLACIQVFFEVRSDHLFPENSTEKKYNLVVY